MGQSSSSSSPKKPKDIQKRGSSASESTQIPIPVKRTLFDHIIDQIVDKSAGFLPKADPPDPQFVNKIHEKAFVDVLFSLPQEVDGDHHIQILGSHWFRSCSPKSFTEWIDRNLLVKACERHHGIIDDQLALSTYLHLYASDHSNGGSKHLMGREELKAFLELSLFLYLLDSWSSDEADQKNVDHGEAQIDSILSAVFNATEGEEPKDARQVLKYVENNLPTLFVHVHKFVLFRLVQGSVIGGVFTNRVVLDRGDVDASSFRQLLTKHKMWQLSSVLPVIPFFKGPVDKNAQGQAPSGPASRRPSYYMATPFGKDASSAPYVATWQMLYNSDAHGVGTNRFTHHVLGYKGPTVMLVLAKDPKTDEIFEFVLAQSQEWRESMSTVFADKFACAVEIRHQFKCLGRQKVTPWLYYNMGTQRGQKKGIFLGETGEPSLLSLDESFDNAVYQKRNLHVLRIEVWGCGTQEDRARQLDVKKWQVREAEKQRVVKLSADEWLDHPDPYLLEMSGRQSYVTKEKK